jgi:succinate-acetate transporter protein
MSNKTANPAPLGLMGFGFTTVLLNLMNARLLDTDALGMILPMGIFFGGLAQIIAGLLEEKHGNTFGTVAFTSYGCFWLSFVAMNILPKMGLSTAASPLSVSAYLAVWGIFTALMFMGTLKANRALQLVFASLAVLFFVLAIGDYTGIETIRIIGGYEGILCGFSAVYLATAEVLNEAYGRAVLPIGKIT